MVTIKTPEEIKLIKQGGQHLSKILGEIISFAKPGVTTEEIDALAERLMRACGGEPAFRGYKIPGSPPFPSVLCISINEEVVHAPATPSRILKDGDIVGFDIGIKWPAEGYRAEGRGHREKYAGSGMLEAKSGKLEAGKKPVGFFTDMAATIGIGAVSKEARELMRVTRESLMRGLRVIKPGNLISDIGREVESYVKKFGYGIVKDLVGHGVGYAVHEDPPIPNYFDARMPKVEIQEGMVLAIEPMITMGKADVKTLADKWTVATRDKSLAAHFEVTVVVTNNGHEIATPLPQLM